MGERLAGRVAIVTGGTQGIGAAICRRFRDEGARVVLVARHSDAGRRAVAELGAEHARFVQGDVAEEATAARAVATAEEEFGGLDVLVNNAALDFVKPIADTSAAEARHIFDVNFHGAFLMLREAGGAMRGRGRGAIVNVISRYALVGGTGMGVYGASKGALLSLTRAAAIEWAPSGVRVNAVAPALTETPLIESWIQEQRDPEAFRAQLLRTLPLGRMAEPEDIAAAVLYLASDEARLVTGACLAVDAGYTAG